MEEKLSFIPKKNLSSRPISRRGGGGFVLFSFLIFVLSAALWGGLYMYKNYLSNNIIQLDELIKKQKDSFETPTINEIASFSEKISVAQNILAKHKAFSNVLDFLQDFTMKDVKFNDLGYSFANDDLEGPSLTLSGETRSYASLATQIQTMEKYNRIRQVSVSGLSSNAKGGIKFNLKIILDPAIVAYTIK